jgi:hypothetical protein
MFGGTAVFDKRSFRILTVYESMDGGGFVKWTKADAGAMCPLDSFFNFCYGKKEVTK